MMTPSTTSPSTSNYQPILVTHWGDILCDKIDLEVDVGDNIPGTGFRRGFTVIRCTMKETNRHISNLHQFSRKGEVYDLDAYGWSIQCPPIVAKIRFIGTWLPEIESMTFGGNVVLKLTGPRVKHDDIFTYVLE